MGKIAFACVLTLWLSAGDMDAMEAVMVPCSAGSVQIQVGGVGTATPTAAGLYSGCTITVYTHGTTSPATIFSDNLVPPTSLGNPFTAGSTIGAGAGYGLFYVVGGRYDIRVAGGTPAPGISPAYTYSDILTFDPLGPNNDQNGCAMDGIRCAALYCSTPGVLDQSCITNAITNLGGPGEILLPKGTINASAPIAITTNGIVLQGQGMMASIVQFTGTTDGFQFNASGAMTQIQVRDMTIRTSNASGGKALNVSPSSLSEDFIFENVNFDTTGVGAWAYGIWAQNMLVSNLNSLRFRFATAGVPIHLDKLSNSVTITGVDIGGTFTKGVELVGADNTKILGGTIEGAASSALLDCNYTSFYTSGVSVYGTFFENSGSGASGITAESGCDNLNLDGIWMTGTPYVSGVSTSAVSFALKRSYLSIAASTAVVSVGGTGTSVPVLIEANFINNTTSSAPAVVVNGVNSPNITGGNKIQSNGGTGIVIGSTTAVQNPVVSGNELPGGSGVTGIAITTVNVTGGVYTGNSFDVSGANSFSGGQNDFRFGNSSVSGSPVTSDNWIRVWDGGTGFQQTNIRAVYGNGTFSSGASAVTFAGGFTFFSSTSYRCFVSPLTTPEGIAWNTTAANAITVHSANGSDSQGYVYWCFGL